MDSRRGEEFKIPLLDKFCSFEVKNRMRYYLPYIGRAVFVVAVYALVIWCMLTVIYKDNHPIQPEIQLKSILVCPTNNESVIWDLKFDIINTYNDAYDVCVFGFEVYLFLYNQTKLLAKTYANPVSPGEYIDPGYRASVTSLAEANAEDLSETNGTIRLDLKLHNHNYDLVCGDAKVELSSILYALPCGSMVGDPFACSYQPHNTHRLLNLLVGILLLLILSAVLGLICWHTI